MKKIIKYITIIAMLSCVFAVNAQNLSIKKGVAAPDFSVKMIDGTEVSLSTLKGKTVLLHFWATWCPPCVRELPHIADMAIKYSNDITVLTISAGEDKNTVLKFLESKNGNLSSLISGYDDNGLISSKYNVSAIPYTIFINKDGIVSDLNIGAYTPEKLENAIKNSIKK